MSTAGGDSLAESMITQFIAGELVQAPLDAPLGRDTKLIQGGVLDSLSILRLVQFLEEKLDVKVAPDDVVPENFETIGSICRFVDEKRRK